MRTQGYIGSSVLQCSLRVRREENYVMGLVGSSRVPENQYVTDRFAGVGD